MHYLIIDTCVWIDLCTKYTKLRDKIADLVDRGQLVLIVPQIVLHEWERKKPEIVKRRADTIRGQIKNARAIAQRLGQQEADDFARILDGFQQRKDKIERPIRSEIEAVDHLLKHPSTITLEPADKVKLQAVDLALAKKAPFRDRNSMADALIVLSALDYVTEQGLDNCTFVSSNTTDFSSESDKTQIHPDLEPLFDDCGMKYCSNIGLTINQIEAGLVSDESIEAVERDIRIATVSEEWARAWSRTIAELGPVLTAAYRMEPFLKQLMKSSLAFDERIGQIVQQIMAELGPALTAGYRMEPFLKQLMKSSLAFDERIGQITQQITESLRDQQEQMAQLPASGTAYVGSKDSIRFHLSACTHARRILPDNLIRFASRDEAVAKGYVPCGTCKP